MATTDGYISDDQWMKAIERSEEFKTRFVSNDEAEQFIYENAMTAYATIAYMSNRSDNVSEMDSYEALTTYGATENSLHAQLDRIRDNERVRWLLYQLAGIGATVLYKKGYRANEDVASLNEYIEYEELSTIKKKGQ